MSVRAKLLVIILFVALVPLTVSALMALGVHRRAYDEKIAEIHRMTATHGAARADGYLSGATRQLALLAGQTIRWTELSPQERTGALWLVHQQQEGALVASLLDDTGRGVGPSAYSDESVGRSTLDAFSRRIPFADAQRDGTAVGEPFWAEGARAPMLPVGVRVAGPDASRTWVVALCLSLAPLCGSVASASGAGVEVLLLDSDRHQICPYEAGRPLSLAPAWLSRPLDAEGREVLVASAPMGSGWTVVARQPAKQAMAASRDMAWQTALWIAVSLGIAVAAGILLGRSVSEPIARLVHGAGELARGNLSYRLRMPDTDEFGSLGAAFDQMSEAIAARDAEIRTWNKELQARVDARTRDLNEAHELLLRSQKLAALSTLSEGVAHEINNPLTSVLGITQILLDEARSDPSRAKEASLLEHVERAGVRMKGIVKRILALAEPRTRADLSPVRVNALFDATVHLLEREIAAAEVEVTCDFVRDPPPVLGEFTQLQQALLQVLGNAIAAIGHKGRITLRTWTDAALVKLSVADSGKGIAPDALAHVFEPFYTTNDASAGEGLGLAIVHRIVDNHHGTIAVVSDVGKGTTVTIAIPAMKSGADVAEAHGD